MKVLVILIVLSAFKPFDSVAKRTEATVLDKKSGNIFKVSKGAPQVILSLLNNNAGNISKVQTRVDALANKGYRSLGVAKTDTKGNWEFTGIISLSDPPREDSKETIKISSINGS